MPGICHRCDKTVYFNEERMAIGKSFHKTCFVCANKGCGRRLDSGNLTEHNADVYCRSCYGKLFGPKGYGYGVGAGVLATDATTINTKVVNETTTQKIGETVVVKPASSISSSVSSSASSSPVNSVSSTPSPQPPSPIEASSTPDSSGTCSPTSDEAISLESDKRETPSPTESTTSPDIAPAKDVVTPTVTSTIPSNTSVEISNKGSVAKMINNNNSINSIANGIAAKLRFGGSEICPRCNKAVYMAERMMGGGSAWHKTSCFNCKECHKRLESTTLCEKDHEIYCKTCYRKNWGPKGYGYGVTALQSCK